MKKRFVMIVLFALLMITPISSYGYDGDVIEKINQLDLRLLKDHPSYAHYARMSEALDLKENATYTLVMSKSFLGYHWDNIDQVELEFEELDAEPYYNVKPIRDIINERAYYTFQTIDGDIDILCLPIGVAPTSEIIIYEGDYEDFPGYIPFLDEDDPVAYYGVLPIDFDNQPTLDEIHSYIIAKDPYGSTLTSTLIYDEYSTSDKRPGHYQMVFETSYQLIRKRYYLDVSIFDITPPTLWIEGPLDISLVSKWSIDQIKEQINISDNVDILDETDLEIISDNYTSANELGTYHIIFSIEDSAHNQSQLDVEINLIDSDGPTVSGPSFLYLYATDTPLTNLEILSKFSANDLIDGTNVTLDIIHNDYQQTKQPGQYLIQVKACDQSNNETLKDLYIQVIDNRSPIYEQTDFVIDKTTADQMTESEMIDWLRNQLNLAGYQATDIVVTFSEYDEHQHEEGQYYVYLTYKINEEEMTSRILVNVEKEPFAWEIIAISSGVIVCLGGILWFVIKRKKGIH